jgi:DNA-binding beta-propeller fold protein YncE
MALLAAACVPPKASLDYTFSEGIIWPGPPEKPRITYLWTLWRVRGGEGGPLMRALAGTEHDVDIEDIRESPFLKRPHGVFVDDDEVLYVTDLGRAVVVDLKTSASYLITMMGDLPLAVPIGITASPDGRVFLADSDLGLVGIYTRGGRKFLRLLEGWFERPTGLALSTATGRLYVSDSGAHTVYVYDLDGKRLGSIGRRGEGPGEFNYPTHVAVDREGLLYVADTLNFRVQIFSPEGVFLSSFGRAGDSYMEFDKIKGIAVDSEGHIYVTDAVQDMVKIFDREGRILLFFGKKGFFYGQFYLPAGIHIDSRDRIFVADALNRRVQAFQFLGGDGE